MIAETIEQKTESQSKAVEAFRDNLKHHLRMIIYRMTNEQVTKALECDEDTVCKLRNVSPLPTVDVSLDVLVSWISKLNHQVVTQVLPNRPFAGIGAPDPRKRNARGMQYAYGVTSNRKH